MYLCLTPHTSPAHVQMLLELALTSYWAACIPYGYATWFFAMGAAILDPPSWRIPYFAHGQLTRMQHGSSSIFESALQKFQAPNTHKLAV